MNENKKIMKNFDMEEFEEQIEDFTSENQKIIMNALLCEDFEQGYKMLDDVTSEGKSARHFACRSNYNNFENIGRLDFFARLCIQVYDENDKEFMDLLSLDKLFSKCKKDDALHIAKIILGVNSSSNQNTAIKYLTTCDLESALSLFNNVNDYDRVPFVNLCCAFINRADVTAKIDIVSMLENHLKEYFPEITNILNYHNPFSDKPTEKVLEALELLNEKCGKYKFNTYFSYHFNIVFCCYDKSEFLSKFVALLLANYSYFTKDVNLHKSSFDTFNSKMKDFVTFIDKFTINKMNIIMTFCECALKPFKNKDWIDRESFIQYITSFGYFNMLEDFLHEKCDMSNTSFDIAANQDIEHSILKTSDERYNALFGEDELLDRMIYLHNISHAFSYATLSDPDQINVLSKYNLDDNNIIRYFSNGDFSYGCGLQDYDNHIDKIEKDPVVKEFINLTKNRKTLLDTFVKDYKNFIKDVRILIVIALFNNNIDEFHNISETALGIKDIINKLYMKKPKLAKDILIMLESKRVAERKKAFHILKDAYGTTYKTNIEKAIEVEENEKLKLEMETYLIMN